ncbi:uncharacterized protein LOC27207506 isoform X2 [Drosophila simulans]|nr:uncharacterized protein LOC27207506 isoform X2 [Drosophila simulans]KMY91496.1 uncharacterized protein Dsimw501_GD27657, isoform C [Drosophila simulans]
MGMGRHRGDCVFKLGLYDELLVTGTGSCAENSSNSGLAMSYLPPEIGDFNLVQDVSTRPLFTKACRINLWCTKKGTHGKKYKKSSVQCNIENSGHMPIVTEWTECVEKICQVYLSFKPR